MKYNISIYLVMVFTMGTLAQESNQILEKSLEEYIWDLSTLYESNEDWENEHHAIETELEHVNHQKYSKINSPQELLQLLKSVNDLSIRAGKMSVYGYLVSTVDENSEITKRQVRIGQLLETKVKESMAILPELILEIPHDSLPKWLENPKFEPYRRQINEIVENQEHHLKGIASQINNSLQRWAQQSYDNYVALQTANIDWPKINDSTTIDFTNYRRFFSENDPEKRHTSLQKFFNQLKDFQDVFANFFADRIEANHLMATNTGYKNGIAALFSKRDGYSDAVIETAIKTVNDSLHVFHQVFETMLHFSEAENPTFPDIYYSRSKFNVSQSYPVGQALNRTVDILSPLGGPYRDRLVHRINDNRMHLPILPEKSGGAFATYPSVGGMKSFLVLPYYKSYSTASALTGGLALMMAYSDMPKERPFLTRYDPPIYSNAIIYAGRNLFDDHMADTAEDDTQKMTFLMNSLFNTFRSFFNYVVFADFEREVQQRVANGDVLSGNQVSNIYLKKMRHYYGHGNVMEIPEYFGTNWITYGTLFSSYDQMFWPPAYACGIKLAKGFKEKDQKIMELFSGVLGNKKTDRTKDLLGDVIDLESSEPYVAVVERIKEQLAQVKQLMNAK